MFQHFLLVFALEHGTDRGSRLDKWINRQQNNAFFSFFLPCSGFYTGWLLPAAVVGVIVFFYGVFTMNTNTIAVETCQEGDKYTMCPLCEECSTWHLSDICLYKRIAYLFDHPGTVFYAIFMSFWGELLCSAD